MAKKVYPVHIDLGEELKLCFKGIPVVKSYHFFWKLAQKVLKSNSNSEKKDIYTIIGDIINNFSEGDIDEIIEIHSKYIFVLENEKENPINIEFHFSDKPYLVFTLIYKILEVYYADFFIELLNSLGFTQITEGIKESFKTMKESVK